MRSIHLARILLALPATLGLVGACVDEAEPPDLGETDSELVLGTEDWNVLPSFETNSLYWKGAGYGRAVADLALIKGGQGGACTGWLISDDILVTAKHCRDDDQKVTATFGKYDNTVGSAALGVADARIRLTQLGVPSSQAFDLGVVPTAFLTTYTCHRVDQEIDGRDVDYYRCSANALTLNVPPFNRNRTFLLKPGHLFGNYELAVGSRSDGDGLYMTSVNRFLGSTAARSVLFSPNGWIDDAYDDTLDDGWPGSFEIHGADGRCGSSGGVVVERLTNRAYGVFVGAYGISDCAQDNQVYPNTITYSNVGTYLSNKANTWAANFAGPESLPSIGTHTAPWAGGSGGTSFSATCPANYVAAGVATTLYNTMVGNLALVCVPFQKSYNLVLGDQDVERNLDEAVVISGGSVDTGYHRVSAEDFNQFIHEVTSGPDTRLDHDLTMCPPGSYLSGIKTRVQSGGIKSIRSIQCRELQQRANLSNQWWVSSYTADIVPFIGYSSQGTNADSLCQLYSYATGITIRSGSWTDGLQVRCTQLYSQSAVPPGGGAN